MRQILVRAASAAFLIAVAVASTSTAQTQPNRSMEAGGQLSASGGENRRLSLADIYGSATVEFSGQLTSYRWLNASKLVESKPSEDGRTWHLVDAEDGSSQNLFEPEKLAQAIIELTETDGDRAHALAQPTSLELSPDAEAMLMEIDEEIYLYRFETDSLTRVTSNELVEELVHFSDDSRKLGFVANYDLYSIDLDSGETTRLTTDGGENLFNGKLDWVYQEELYGRYNYKGYWWSRDASHIAFLQTDQEKVPDYTIVDHIPYRLELEVYPYPKAGDPNPEVKLGVVEASGGSIQWADLSKYDNAQILVVHVDFSPTGDVIFQVQDRNQTWLDLNRASAETGKVETLFRETSPAWVNRMISPHYLPDGSFLWFSERSGFKHLYHYSEDGSLIRQITNGKWEARTLHGFDETRRLIYFSGTERSHIGSDVYQIGLGGENLTRLTDEPGTHSAQFSPELRYFVHRWSDVTTPPQQSLRRADGSLLRALDGNDGNDENNENVADALNRFHLSEPELLQVPAGDGFEMEAFLLKPPDFDPNKSYPVWVYGYGGPHAQSVRNAWGGRRYLWFQFLAQNGFIVWVCDNRIASGKGAESTWKVYKNFGEQELADLEDSVAWLKQKSFVDGERIGLAGWSFGGFMTSYAMTHSDTFSVGIAGGSVTDWRDYDTIYTERYMSTPEENPEGYEKASVRNAASDLRGKLLLVHGTMDDNVHVQNTLQFAYDLQKAGRDFDMMLYPRSRHGISDPDLVLHMREKMAAFIFENLKTTTAPTQ